MKPFGGNVKINGSVWKFPQDDIDTDQIRSAIYGHLPLRDQAKHCMEALDRDFASKARSGDIIVGGKNFGCGSSRPAYAALMALGVGAVIAESFSTIFFRSSIGGGLLVMVCPGIIDFVNSGDRIELDVVTGLVRNLTAGKSLAGEQLPSFLREMVELGGEKPYLKARLARDAGAKANSA